MAGRPSVLTQASTRDVERLLPRDEADDSSKPLEFRLSQ